MLSYSSRSVLSVLFEILWLMLQLHSFVSELAFSLLTLMSALGLGACLSCTAGEGALWMKQLGQKKKSSFCFWF